MNELGLVTWLNEAIDIEKLSIPKRIALMRRLVAKLAIGNTKNYENIGGLQILLAGERRFGELHYLPSSYKRKAYSEFNKLVEEVRKQLREQNNDTSIPAVVD